MRWPSRARRELTVRNRYQLRPSAAPAAPEQTGLDMLRNVLSAAPLAESQNCVGPEELAGEGFHMSRVGGPFFRNMGLGESIGAPTPESIAEATTLRSPPTGLVLSSAR